MLRAAALLCVAVLIAACGGGDSEDQVVASPRETGSADSSVDLKSPRPSPRRTREATARPTTPPKTATPADFAKAKVKLTKILDMSEPVALSQRPNDTTLYVAEKGGRIKAVKGGKVTSTVLDISSQVTNEGEQGLLGFAFNPKTDKFYVYFTDRALPRHHQVVREYTFSGGKGVSPRDVLVMDDPYGNHNGGNILFGPDGHLYIGTGDGGSAGDPENRAQDLNSLLGKMLRIDPNKTDDGPYHSPSGNPFVGKDGRDEIWSFGLRNPWRFSFDRSNKDIWIGDVGQYIWEEVNRQPGSAKGTNYGWRLREGNHQFRGRAPSGHVGPVFEYNHDDGNCSVTGGFVYRGAKIKNLYGAYLFADFCVGRLRGFVLEDGRAQGHRFLGPEAQQLASFGQDSSGELYVMSLGGGFYRIDPA
jgi:glucose/arabinose dehydrogenase